MRYLKLFFLTTMMLFSVELSNVSTAAESDENTTSPSKHQVFGANLFSGRFAQSTQHRYNKNYLINIGDQISLKLWGAFDLEILLTVDKQGQIFIPKVGTIHLLGVRNGQLTSLIQQKIKSIYKNNVFAYADLLHYQPVEIFVTGNVKKPGLYSGLSSDSVLQFIDKAQGIIAESGSYRNIQIMRNNVLMKTVDIYDFLINGKMGLFQFQMGDVIRVDDLKYFVDVSGAIKRPLLFELKNTTVTLKTLCELALLKDDASSVLIESWSNPNEKNSSIVGLDSNVTIHSGDTVTFLQDYNQESISLAIEGEHHDRHHLSVQKGVNLKEIIDKIEFSKLSKKDSIILYRKSIAKAQKELLESSLRDLEASALTTGSSTSEEAIIRAKESQQIINFVERARKVEPKGQIVINAKSDLSQIILEDEDTIFIPKKSHMVVVQGEVMLPGAQTFVKNRSLSEYLEASGGYNFRADKEHVLVIRQNGKVVNYNDKAIFGSAPEVFPGDSILVLGKVDSKNLQIVKDITQILYQVAVGAAVVLNAF